MTKRLLSWLSVSYLVLVGIIASVVVAIAVHHDPEIAFSQLGWLFGDVMIWPLWLFGGLIGIWYLGALVLYAFWKYLELIQWVTGIRVGERIGRALADDRYLRNSSSKGPYAWLYQRVVQRYPIDTVDG